MGNCMRVGQVKAVVDSRFASGDVLKAFERSETGSARGKIVVEGAAPVASAAVKSIELCSGWLRG